MTDTPTNPIEPVPVPCTPCLLRLLAGTPEWPHACELTTRVSIRGGGDLVIGAAQDCPCRCPVQPESPALQAARAEARQRTSPT